MRRAAEAWRISGDGLIPVLAVTAACFLLGGLVGCLLASHIGGGGLNRTEQGVEKKILIERFLLDFLRFA